MVFRHSSISCLVRLILNPSKTTAWVVSIFFSLFQLQFHRSASSQLYCDFWSSLTITSRNHWVLKAGFPTGVANMGILKIWWGGAGGGLSQNMEGAWGELKMLSKKICDRVHLIVNLSAIILQSSRFTKSELLHTYFSRILARF